jgi:hypothetical protein
MPVLFFDVETRSAVNLKIAGAHRYAADASTDIWFITYAVNDGPINVWVPGQSNPEPFVEAEQDPSYEVAAHNDGFERTVERLILYPRYGWPLIPLARRRCSMAMALAQALPGALEKVGEALQLTHRKDMEGEHLMKRMARPRRPRKDEDPDVLHWIDDPVSLARLRDYGIRDLESQRELFYRLPPLSPVEQLIWQLDAEINDAGFAVDLELARAARELVQVEQKRVKDELTTLTNGRITSVNQHDRIATLLREHGHNVTGIAKRNLAQVLARGNPCELVRQVIELRKEGGKTGVSKLPAIFRKVSADQRARGTLRYHAAGPGRWSGSGIQPQNFPKVTIDNPDAAIAAVLSKDIERVRGLGEPLEIISSTLRGVIRAAPGHVLLGGDFSSIESRIVAWFAGEEWKLTNYREFDRTGNPELEPYCVTGTRLLGRKVTPDDKAGRAVGKVGDLALGFGGGAGAWRKWDDTSSDEEVNRYVATWRKAHPATVLYWRRIENAARTCVVTGRETRAGRIKCQFVDGNLYLILPSGRRIAYPQAHLGPGKYEGTQQVWFMDNAKGGWKKMRAWHGTFTENVVQGTARDLLAAAMLRLREAGFKIVLHVHDEAVCEEPADIDRTEEFHRLLTTLPDWAAGLPIAAKTWRGERYTKSEAEPEPEEEGDQADIAQGENEGVSQVTDPAENAPAAFPEAHSVRTETESGPGAPWDDPLGDIYADAGTVGPQWSTPILDEVPPGSTEFETILASLSEEDRTIVRPAAAGNGHDQTASQQRAQQNHRHSSDGRLHGDGGSKRGKTIGQWIYQDLPDRPNYLRVDKHVLPDGKRKFYQHHWNGAQWIHGVKGTYAERKIPYRLPELRAALRANPDTEVQIPEGEKDADTLAQSGYVATTNPGGALSWTDDLTAWLRILDVRRAAIHEDNDEKGRQRTAKLIAALGGFIKLRVIRYPDVPEGEDVTWWLEHGHSKEELKARIEAAEPAGIELDEWDAGELLNSGLPEPRQWLMSRQFCRGFLSGLVAPGDVGKTTLRLTQAIELATRRELLGNRIYQRCRVLVISLEDDREELRRRLLAICRHHGIDPGELTGWLFCRELNGAKLARLNAKGGRELGELDHMLRGAIERRRPDLIILDPFVKLHALNENDNPDMDFVCSHLVKLAQDYNIAVDSPAHTHKGQIAAGDADARRGASAQRDAGRLDYTLTAMSEDEANRFGIDPDERKSYVRLDRAKANLVRAIKAMWFRLVSVPLGNTTKLYPEGDDMQAIEAWVPPDAWQGLDASRINQILDWIEAGMPDGNRYSADGNAKKRAAWQVVLDVVPEKSEAQAREIIKTWVKTGLLVVREYQNPADFKKAKGLYVDPAKRAAAA